MATLTVRDLPSDTLESLKARASMNHRSLNGEVLYIFDYIVSGRSEYDLLRETRIKKQREALDAVFGKWEDSRSTTEIISDIEGSRTRGRKVSL